MPSIVLYVPLSPSVNSLWNNVNRRGGKGKWRVPTKTYQEWKSKAYAVIRTQLEGEDWKTLESPCQLLIACEFPSRKSDLSNRIKALEDALVGTKVIADDHLIYDLCIHWVEGLTKPAELVNLAGPLMRVAVRELSQC